MNKNELLLSYHWFYHITDRDNYSSVLKKGLLLSLPAPNDFHPQAPYKRPHICFTPEHNLENQLSSFRNSGKQYIIFKISAENLITKETGLDWTFSGTETLISIEEVDALQTSLESFGVIACFNEIPSCELEFVSMTEKKVKNFIKEICTKGDILQYEQIINTQTHKIVEKGCSISCRYDRGHSVFEQQPDKPPHIRISLIDKKPTPLNIIWAILHEYGHLVSGNKKKEDDTIDREELAWENAQKELKEYPELLKEESSFLAYKTFCLNSYYSRQKE